MKPKITKGWKESYPVDLDRFHEHAVEWAVKRFNEKPAHEILTGYFIFAGHGISTIVYVPFEGPGDKYHIAAAIRQMLNNPIGEEVVEAYSFITEAWAAVAKKGEDFDWTVPPSQREDREDIFTIATTKRDGTSKFTRFGVKMYPGPLPFMPPKKKPRLLERDDQFGDDATNMAGVMVNFFDTLEESEKKMHETEITKEKKQ